MKRLLLAIVCAVLLSGCGGSSSEGSARDEANVVFKPPMLMMSALEMARRHHVQPIDLTMEFAMLGETITARTPVESGMSDNEIVRHVRESESGLTEDTSGSLLRDTQMANLREVQRRIRNSPLRIAQMRASGAADDLRALRDEPGVEAAGLKSEIVECVRRAREDVRKGDERLARTCNA